MRARHACVGVTWLWRGGVSLPARRAVEIDELEQLFTLDLPDFDPELGVRDDATTVATGMGEAVVSSLVRFSRVAVLLAKAIVALAVVVVILVIVCVAGAVHGWSVTEVVFNLLIGAIVLDIVALIAFFVVGWWVKQ